MAKGVEVTVYLDFQLDLKAVKQCRPGSTIRDLKWELAQEDPTGSTCVEDFVLVPVPREGASPLKDSDLISDSCSQLVVTVPQESVQNALDASDEKARLQAEYEEQIEHLRKLGVKDLPPPPDLNCVGHVANTDAEEMLEKILGEQIDNQSSNATIETGIEKLNEGHGSSLEVVNGCEYLVTQGVLFKKPGTDPSGGKVLRLSRGVGTAVQTTGVTWAGPKGGEWVELDATVEKPGWLLVQGPGFGIEGPLLHKMDPEGQKPLVLCAARPVVVAAMDGSNVERREFLVTPSTRIVEVKSIVGSLFGLDRRKIIVSKPQDPGAVKQTAGNVDAMGPESLLEDSATVFSAGFQHGSEVPFIYTGTMAS